MLYLCSSPATPERENFAFFIRFVSVVANIQSIGWCVDKKVFGCVKCGVYSTPYTCKKKKEWIH